jgi:hypothetical protein
MARNLIRTLGAALMAALAISAVAASVASATNDVFEAEKSPIILTGEQVEKNKFTLAGQATECTTVTFKAMMTSTPVTEVKTVEPTLGGCTFGGGAAEIHLNGCKLNFNGITDASGDAQASVVDCNAGRHIEITLKAIKCILTVKGKGASDGNQIAEEGVHYTSDGTGTTKGMLVDGTVKLKLTSAPEGGQAEGVTCASLTNTTGTIHGTVTVTGEESSAPFSHVGVSFK